MSSSEPVPPAAVHPSQVEEAKAALMSVVSSTVDLLQQMESFQQKGAPWVAVCWGPLCVVCIVKANVKGGVEFMAFLPLWFWAHQGSVEGFVRGLSMNYGCLHLRWLERRLLLCPSHK
jgi:hypothetical protein